MKISDITKQIRAFADQLESNQPLAPDAPPFQLPPPPPGMQWHRTDGWKAEDLPKGYRPLAEGEIYQKTLDEMHWEHGWEPLNHGGHHTDTADDQDIYIRTTRPLTFDHAGKTWTWHRPGDPMPCDGERMVEALLLWEIEKGETLAGSQKASKWFWSAIGSGGILGWRYAEPATKEVELGPEDVPPGSVFRLDKWDRAYTSGAVFLNGVHLLWPIGQAAKFLHWSELQKEWFINLPRHRDTDGNPTKWEPCSKTIPA